MIIIQGSFEGELVSEIELADEDGQLVEDTISELYADGCDYVEVIGHFDDEPEVSEYTEWQDFDPDC